MNAETITLYFAEFTPDSGSRVKVYGRNAITGAMQYLGHFSAGGFRDAGYVVDVNAVREIITEKVKYFAWDKWCDR